VRRRHSWPHRILALRIFWVTAMTSLSSADIHRPRYLKDGTGSIEVCPAVNAGVKSRETMMAWVTVRRRCRSCPFRHSSLRWCRVRGRAHWKPHFWHFGNSPSSAMWTSSAWWRKWKCLRIAYQPPVTVAAQVGTGHWMVACLSGSEITK